MFEYGPLPPLMFLSMVVFMLYGFPVAFSLGAVGLFFGIIGIATEHFDPAFLQALPRRVFSIVSNDLLLAIPIGAQAAATSGGNNRTACGGCLLRTCRTVLAGENKESLQSRHHFHLQQTGKHWRTVP